MTHISKHWTFDAAHRLVMGYQGKCAHLHGHTYKVEVSLASKELDKHGFVLDFEVVKTKLKAWTDANMDHATILAAEDGVLLRFLEAERQKKFILPGNPTAENIATYLFRAFEELLKDEADADRWVEITAVEVWETPTSSAVCYGVDDCE